MSVKVTGKAGSFDTQANVGQTRNRADGLNSHSEGSAAVALLLGSHAEGYNTFANGDYSHAEGQSTTAGGSRSHAAGLATVAGYNNSTAIGAYSATAVANQFALGSGLIAGRSQLTEVVLTGVTSDATTPTLLTADGAAAVVSTTTGTSDNVSKIGVSRVHLFTVTLVARNTTTAGQAAGMVITGMVSRGTALDAAIVGTPDVLSWTQGAFAPSVTVAVNNINASDQHLGVTAIGVAAQTINWTAVVRLVEVG